MSRRRLATGTDALALALAVSSMLLLSAAFLFPFLHSELLLAFPAWLPRTLAERLTAWIIESGRIPAGDQYLAEILLRLFQAREYAVGVALFLFSIVLPSLKMILAASIAGGVPMLDTARRWSVLWLLRMVSKWSMADVFVVGMVVVFFKAEGFHFAFEAGTGLYCYAASALLSSWAVSLLSTVSLDAR